MNPTDFNDSLTFPVVPQLNNYYIEQNIWIAMKSGADTDVCSPQDEF